MWTRQLVFVFGSTTFASATVLAVFMGGLAIGSFVAGRFSDRLTVKKALLWYGILEGIIGLWALLVPFLFQQAIPVYRFIWQHLHLSVMPFSLLRFAAAAVILLPPTSCMGATLPLLSRFVVGSLDYVGRRVGTLYAINTLGAVFGSLTSGFLLLPTIGLNATNISSAAINFVLLAAVAGLTGRVPEEAVSTQPDNQAQGLSVETNAEAAQKKDAASGTSSSSVAINELPKNKRLSRKERRRQRAEKGSTQETGVPVQEPPDKETVEETPRTNDVAAKPVLTDNTNQGRSLAPQTIIATIAFAASGAVAMMYEVAWTRALLLIVGSTTYAFTCMLSSFLIGIFLGSLIASRFADRLNNALMWFGGCQLVVGLIGIAAVFGFNYVPYLSILITAHEWSNHELAQASRFALSGLVLLPISLFLGATFPLVIKACARDLEAIGRSVGTLYSANTFGAIVGAFLAGFVVVPLLGIEKTLVLCAGTNLLIGLFAFTANQPRLKLVIISGAMVATIGATGWTIASTKIWDQLALLDIQTIRRAFRWRGIEANGLPNFQDWLARMHSDINLLCYYDGACGTAGVYETTHNHWRSLLTNGHVDASYGDQPTQVLLAALPLAVYPQAKDICVVGWGSGVTVGVAGKWHQSKVTAIEIEPVVVKASKYFSQINHEPYNNPKVKLEKNDGRNYLLATDRQFDLIISEPSNPWQSGVCNLFTKEFFESSRRSLRPNGVFALWLQINEISPKNVLRILSALHSVYPYVMPMQTKLGDLAVLASARPMRIDRNNINRIVKDPVMNPIVTSVGIKSAHEVAARIMATPDSIAKLVEGVEPNSDDLNHLEYEVSKTYETTSYHAQNEAMFNSNAGKLWDCINWEDAQPEQQAFTCANIGISCNEMGSPSRVAIWTNHSTAIKVNPAAIAASATADRDLGHFIRATEEYKKALALDPHSAYSLVRLMNLSRFTGNLSDMRAAAQTLCNLQPNDLGWRYELARTYMPSMKKIDDGPLSGPDEPLRAKALLEPIVQNPDVLKKEPFIQALWAATCYDTGNKKEAFAVLNRYLKLYPADFHAMSRLAKWYHTEGNQAEYTKCQELAQKAMDARREKLIEAAETDIDREFIESAVLELSQALELGPCPQAVSLLEQVQDRNSSARRILQELKAQKKGAG